MKRVKRRTEKRNKRIMHKITRRVNLLKRDLKVRWIDNYYNI